MQATTPPPHPIPRLPAALLPPVVLAALLLLAPGIRALAAQTVPDPPEAADSVVVVVSAESPVAELPRMRLADIYLGRVSRFPDGRPAVPIDQSPGSRARDAFYETYLGRSGSEIKAHWSKLVFTGRGRPPRDVADGEAVKELVADNPGVLGYLSLGMVDESVRIVRIH